MTLQHALESTIPSFSIVSTWFAPIVHIVAVSSYSRLFLVVLLGMHPNASVTWGTSKGERCSPLDQQQQLQQQATMLVHTYTLAAAGRCSSALFAAHRGKAPCNKRCYCHRHLHASSTLMVKVCIRMRSGWALCVRVYACAGGRGGEGGGRGQGEEGRTSNHAVA